MFECTACDLSNLRTRDPMEFDIPAVAPKILFVGEPLFSGQQASLTSEGALGYLIYASDEIGIKFGDNAVYLSIPRCQVPQKTDQALLNRSARKCIKTNLDNIAKSLNVNIIVIVGGKAAEYFTKSIVSECRSNKFTHSYRSIVPDRVYFYVEDGEFIHSKLEEKDQGPMEDFIMTLKHIKMTADIGIKRTPVDYQFVDTLEKAMEVYQVLKTKKELAVDIETSGLNKFSDKAKILTISFSWEEYQAVCFPVEHEESPFTAEERAVIKELLNDVLSDPEITEIIMHNGKFDDGYMEQRGIHTRNFNYDTMLAHYAIDETRGTHGLKKLALVYTDLGDYDSGLHQFMANAKLDCTEGYSKVPLEILWQYNCCDTDATIRLKHIFEKKIEVEGIEPLFRYLMRLSDAMTQVEKAGLAIDDELLKKLEAEMPVQVDNLENRFFSFSEVIETQRRLQQDEVEKCLREDVERLAKSKSGRTKPKKPDIIHFNPASVHHMRALLFDTLKLQNTLPIDTISEYLTKKGQDEVDDDLIIHADDVPTEFLSTGKKTLNFINDLEHNEIVSTLLEHRQLKKLYGTYIKPMRTDWKSSDGLIHSTSLIHGTACIIKESLLLTKQGLLSFEEVYDIQTLKDNEFKKFVLPIYNGYDEEESSHIYSGGKRETYEVQTIMGLLLRGTEEHPVEVLTEQGIIDKPIGIVKAGDFVHVAIGTNIYGNIVKLPKFEQRNYKNMNVMVNLPEVLTPDMSRLIGYFIAEGSLRAGNGSYTVHISNTDNNVLNDCRDICQKEFNITGLKYYKNTLDQKGIEFTGKNLQEFWSYVSQCKPYESCAVNKEVPKVIRQASKECWVEFLRGMQGDAFIGYASRSQGQKKVFLCIYYSNSLRLLTQMQHMIINMGYRCSIQTHKHYNPSGMNHGGKPIDNSKQYRLVLRGNEAIRFLDEVQPTITTHKKNLESLGVIRKCGTSKRWYRFMAGKMFVRVSKVEPTKELINVYDLTIPSSHHFVANSIVNHNTGRLASTSPNMMNVPRGSLIKQLFISRWVGGTFGQLDYSQVELRVAATLSGDENMLAAFASGIDIHKQTAALMFRVPMSEVTKDQRQAAKTVNFGILYSKKAWSLATDLSITEEEAQDFIDKYFAAFPQLYDWIEANKKIFVRDERAVSQFGRVRKFPGINQLSKVRRKSFDQGKRYNKNLREAGNHLVQSSAADLTLNSVILLLEHFKERCLKSLVLGTVYDSIMIDIYPGEEEEVINASKMIMENIDKLLGLDWVTVQLVADAELGPNWGNLGRLVKSDEEYKFEKDDKVFDLRTKTVFKYDETSKEYTTC